jgi:hypothetical protein
MIAHTEQDLLARASLLLYTRHEAAAAFQTHAASTPGGMYGPW